MNAFDGLSVGRDTAREKFMEVEDVCKEHSSCNAKKKGNLKNRGMKRRLSG